MSPPVLHEFANRLRRLSTLCLVLCSLSVVSPPVRASTDAVNESHWVPVEGGQVYVLVRGGHRTSPILLWLHGGPGGAERPLFRLFNSDLERDFVVAYLDQRGAGRSYDADASLDRLTIAQHLQDLDRVVDDLRARYLQPKVVLVGHSWGSARGLLYARDHALKVAAFVSVGQVVATTENETAQLTFVTNEAARRSESRALQSALQDIGNPPLGWQQDLALQQWVERYGGVFHQPPSQLKAMVTGVALGYVTPWEIYKIIAGNNASLSAMNVELQRLDLRKAVTQLDVPLLMIAGQHDRVTDRALARQLFDQLRDTDKTFVTFDASAHNVPFEEPARFNSLVRDFIARRAASK